MEDFKFYEVGGKIRDELLGLTNKDVDYVAVPTEACYSSIHPRESQPSPARLVFQALKSYLEEPGNLYDDLSRRDFTVNALIRTPLDPLRILRAIRFAVTKRFTIEQTTWQAMVLYDYDSKMPVVSEERIREELIKCFRCNTIRTLTYLDYLPRLRDYIFSKTNLWLKPTNEK